MVVRAEARFPVINANSRHRRVIAGVDLSPRFRSECDVRPFAYRLVVPEAEVRLLIRSKSMGSAAGRIVFRADGHDKRDPQRRKRLLVKPPRAFSVCDRKTDMI